MPLCRPFTREFVSFSYPVNTSGMIWNVKGFESQLNRDIILSEYINITLVHMKL